MTAEGPAPDPRLPVGASPVVEARRRIFEDAQRQADTVFAQYQLSQLLALGGDLRTMASSVIGELVRVTDAIAGAMWLVAPGDHVLRLAATQPPSGTPPATAPRSPDAAVSARAVESVPATFAGAAAAEAWAARNAWHGIALDERRDLGQGELEARLVAFIALLPPPGEALPADGVRLLALVRHELAIAFSAALLRDALAAEQGLLAAILDGASDGIIAVDRDRRVVRVNPAALDLLGGALPPGPWRCRDVLGCAIGTVDGALRCGPRCRFEEVLDGPATLVECEQRIVTADGTDVPVAASYSVISTPQPGAVAVLRDLRAQRAVEELRSSFLGAVSHELRTPLALISGYVDSVLGLSLAPEAQRQAIEGIGRAAARLGELVEELLDLTQVEQAGVAIPRSPVDLATVVEPLAADLGELPGMTPVQVALPADLPQVDIDAQRVGHVLASLVDNASKYGGSTITIGARREGPMVVVTVEDDGPGVAPDERELVFDRRYRGRAASERRARGRGLGLYLCSRLVEAHGGRIWVEPDAGRSAISFTLPVAARALLPTPGRA